MRYGFSAKPNIMPEGGRTVSLSVRVSDVRTFTLDLSPRDAIKLASDLLIAARETLPFEESEIDRATRIG
jgi:hypothetical protein